MEEILRDFKLEEVRRTKSGKLSGGWQRRLSIAMAMIGNPKEAAMTTFRIDNLSGGILIFGQTFVMLFTAILVATDRSTSFLLRLFSSPMKSRDYTNGYILPMILISIIQAIVIVVSSGVTAMISGVELKAEGVGGPILKVCNSLPFLYCTRVARSTRSVNAQL